MTWKLQIIMICPCQWKLWASDIVWRVSFCESSEKRLIPQWNLLAGSNEFDTEFNCCDSLGIMERIYKRLICHIARSQISVHTYTPLENKLSQYFPINLYSRGRILSYQTSSTIHFALNQPQPFNFHLRDILSFSFGVFILQNNKIFRIHKTM